MTMPPLRPAPTKPRLPLCDPAAWALILDVDGTLIDIAARPELAAAPAGLVATLSILLGRLGGALAVISGRRIDDTDRLLFPLRLAGGGVHGAEMRWSVGGPVEPMGPPLEARLVTAIAACAIRHPGVVVENKGFAVAVHYRAVPTVERLLAEEVGAAVAASGCPVAVRRGRKVLEIIPRGRSKAAALERIVRREPFRNRIPIFVGDDSEDEHAMRVAAELSGAGLTVGGEHFPASAADFRHPGEVRRWLAGLADATARGGPA